MCNRFVEGKKQGSKAMKCLMPDVRGVYAGSVRDLLPLPHSEIRKKMKFYNATRPIWTGKLSEAKL